MEPKSSNENVRSGADAPFIKLPEHVDGFVEVQTLVDIHKYLRESEKDDDMSLAAWIKEQYLYEPIAEEGRQIRDVEGFVKLDAAYRRVRLLTGKAQDKWPFFYRNWKKMSSIVVKNIVLRNAAIGADRPVTNSGLEDSSVGNGSDGQRDSTLNEPKLQASFGTKIPTSHKMLLQKSSQSAGPVPASQATPERQAQHQVLLTVHSPPSSVLAAEAEAVPSNLDRLPPGLTGKKRKSEPATPRGGNKRIHGSRDEMLGRHPISEPVTMDSPPNIVEDARAQKVLPETVDAAKVATRRSTRKVAASSLKSPASLESPARNGSQAPLRQKLDKPDTNQLMKDAIVSNDSYGSKSNGTTSIQVTETNKPVLDVFVVDTPSDPLVQSTMSTSEVPDTQKAPKSSKQKKRVSFVPDTEAGVAVDYKFFARIYTSGVTEEISLSEEDLDHRGDIVKRYAAWQKSGEASISFETFKNIVRFAK
ncbi:hypothetical protein N0V95_001408 [Ascochyta clinopodiicola]|nr:hypothetical protein N0V95_001408 [Ascochyta clinopodiicola]